MALMGEGDERWVVTDLGAEGTNVGAWHWVEKDLGPWAKQRLSELFSGAQLGTEQLAAQVTAVEVGGEAALNVRKKKLIAIYELSVTLAVSGKVLNGDGSVLKEVTGKVRPALASARVLGPWGGGVRAGRGRVRRWSCRIWQRRTMTRTQSSR